ncbi:helix-turn-helix domain-containing protein [Halopseudomonas pachastrellae]|uniref:helix-turn-helix transcriptional regulator n=1 Tax=Halopseudomonas pachastrellae TaxID=254161 RepID=UPI003D7D1310
MPSEHYWLSPAVHPIYARLVLAELRRQGYRENPVPPLLGPDWEQQLQGNRFLNLDTLTRLLQAVISLTGHPGLGFSAGLHTDVSTHGPGGYAAVTAATIGEAINLLEHYSPLRQHLASYSLVRRSPPVLQLNERLMPPPVRDYLLGHFTTAMLRLLETVSGQPLGPEITLEWPGPPPEWASEVREHAGRWVFGSDALRLHLPDGLLEQPCLGADAELHRQALRDCEHHLQRQRRGGDLSERIKQRLLQCEYQYPTLAQMAAQEHLTARTLIRHLGSEGVRYQQILDQVRSEQACWLLEHTDLSIEMIAERLGYQDTSNFSRTFRRWLGCPPRGYRQRVTGS